MGAERPGRLAAAFAGLITASASAQPIVESTFAFDDEGWTTLGNAGATVAFEPGAVSQTDSDPAAMAFAAPAKFTGDLSTAYRGELTFELTPSVRPFQPSRPAVEIAGGTGGLAFRIELPAPATFFEPTGYAVSLQENAGWEVVGQSRPPTAAEFRDLLSLVASVSIVADSSAASDEVVALGPVAVLRPTVRVFLAAGQSNMSGCADSRDLPGVDFSPKTEILFWNQFDDQFGPLETGTSDSSCANSGPEFFYGPEIGFGNAMNAFYPGDEIVIIKYTEGGTSLPFCWVPPDVNDVRPNGGACWQRFRDELDLAFAALDNAGISYQFDGMIWYQGERDGQNETNSGLYEESLLGLIDWARERTAEPALPFVLGRTAVIGAPFIQVVRQAQVDVADADLNACWIDTDDLPLFDGLHIAADEQLTLGQRMARATRNLMPRPSDVNADGLVNAEDLYAWNESPIDLNCDQTADDLDLDLLEAAVRGQ